MSTQKGNLSRSRPQKHQNQTVFKNDLYDKSHQIKVINNIEVANVCERCKKIIEWKIKYKKYKLLKTPSKCVKCKEKSVKHAYHNMCLPCAQQFKVCPKCGDASEIIKGKPSKEETVKLDAELQALLKELPERKRRTFIRYTHRIGTSKSNSIDDKNKNKEQNEDMEQKQNEIVIENIARDDLLLKLKSLTVKHEAADDNFHSDSDSDIDCDSLT
ncbi:uncharacterized protein LOC143187562 [Calliopsis andreniformis]|uniref:uncharacterized protein LOC143187562 n=1 Tax=Calliopsis andreniformis TaxID=337506 RepID=UPI003FCD7F5C